MTLAVSMGEICRAFALGAPVGAMATAAKGEQGVIWRLETESGTYAVKELLIRQAESEVGCALQLEEAARRVTSLSLPHTVRSTTGLVLAEIGTSQVRVQTWVDLLGPDPLLEPSAVGRLLADLHNVGDATTDEVDPWYTEPVGRDRWEHYLTELKRVRPPVAATIDQLLPEVIGLEEFLATPSDLRMCHRDLWADNVRSTPHGGLCVIDWDNTGPAAPAHELGMVLWEFGGDDDARYRTLYEAYVDAGGPGRLVDRGDFTMLIAQFGHFYATALDAWIDPEATLDELEWAQGRIDELASRPLSLASIDQLLSAIGP